MPKAKKAGTGQTRRSPAAVRGRKRNTRSSPSDPPTPPVPQPGLSPEPLHNHDQGPANVPILAPHPHQYQLHTTPPLSLMSPGGQVISTMPAAGAVNQPILPPDGIATATMAASHQLHGTPHIGQLRIFSSPMDTDIPDKVKAAIWSHEFVDMNTVANPAAATEQLEFVMDSELIPRALPHGGDVFVNDGFKIRGWDETGLQHRSSWKMV